MGSFLQGLAYSTYGTAIGKECKIMTKPANEGFEAGVPMKRYGLPEEVAALMLFLASSESSYITGCTYPVDGGMTAD